MEAEGEKKTLGIEDREEHCETVFARFSAIAFMIAAVITHTRWTQDQVSQNSRLDGKDDLWASPLSESNWQLTVAERERFILVLSACPLVGLPRSGGWPHIRTHIGGTN